MLKPMEQTSNMLQMVLGGVGAVAMLVSAISIANTMVMSIYERTREIGVMKVLGCVIIDIKKLFLFEAGMIGLMGGILGIIISYIVSFCINKFGGPLFQALVSSTNLTGETTTKYSVIPLWLPILAAAFAMTVGIISGYYPAKRATKISAIEAMKSE
jgi:ABC-type transport system, involved in lipoprotein release, permease component